MLNFMIISTFKRHFIVFIGFGRVTLIGGIWEPGSKEEEIRGNRRKWRESEREKESEREMPQHCFVAQQYSQFCHKTLDYGTFCHKTLKYGTFCRKTLKYGTFCRET